MLRRLTACLLALLLLGAASAQAAMPDDLAILSQWDERFLDRDFYYNNNHFRFGGCGPASVTNALIAVLGVTDQDLAGGIERDVLYMLTNRRPAQSGIILSNLSYLGTFGTSSELDGRYPSLSQAVQEYGGRFLYTDGKVTPETLAEVLPTINGRKTLYHGTLAHENRWANLCGMVRVLAENDYEDAVIVLGRLGAGTSTTQGPFRSGSAGHYLGLYLSVREFREEGVFYVLDSLPRALAGEDYAPNTPPYMLPYDFVGPQKYSTSLEEFSLNFSVERVQTTIVRVRPSGQARVAMKFTSDPIGILQPYLERLLVFFSTSPIFISLPEK